jgi:hypothetical protein
MPSEIFGNISIMTAEAKKITAVMILTRGEKNACPKI